MPIYLDMAATTPTDARVANLVMECMIEEFGNAGSRTHLYGLEAKATVNKARARIAASLLVEQGDVVFTSGATEANNLSILGLRDHAARSGRRHIVSTEIEHKAVLEPLERLVSEGFEVTLVRPDRHGYVLASEVVAAVRQDTLLVSIMHANNETGAVQPITEIASTLTDEEVYLHIDAAQTFGRLNEELGNPRIDLISLSAHKTYGPKGVGALVTRRRNGRRAPLSPLMFGGGQERGLRPGTLPVPLIAGFGLAAELAAKEVGIRTQANLEFRRAALEALAPLRPIVHAKDERGVLPHILSFSVPGVDSEATMVATKDLVAISNGSACTSASYEPSHVLSAMQVPPDILSGTVRMSWFHGTPLPNWQLFVSRLQDLQF